MYTGEWEELWHGREIPVYPKVHWANAKLISKTERETDAYGDYIQGDDDEISLVFKVEDKYFKVTGSQSSYSDTRYWNDDAKEVFPKTVETVVYE